MTFAPQHDRTPLLPSLVAIIVVIDTTTTTTNTTVIVVVVLHAIATVGVFGVVVSTVFTPAPPVIIAIPQPPPPPPTTDDVGWSIPLILLSSTRCASFCFARLRAMRPRALALQRSMMVVAASRSLILLSALRFSCFLFRTATSHALTGASSPEVDDGCFGLHCRLLTDLAG